MCLQRLRYYTGWHHVVNRRDHDAPADPWSLLSVDPTSVEYVNNEIPLFWGIGRVDGGPWDRDENCHDLRDTAVYTGLRQRFEDGDDWEETALYRQAKRRFEDGHAVRGYEDVETYRTVRCEYLDTLFASIERDGYRPNRAAAHDNPAADDNPWEDAYAHHLEPVVVIGRSGDIYLAEGFHRFVMASLLDVDDVPVLVLSRHERWQDVRDAFHRTPASERSPELRQHVDHPDLRDVTE